MLAENNINYDGTECRRCSLDELLSFEEIKARIPEYLETVDEDARVSGEEYKARLDCCFKCEGLAFGVTCKYCGCFVQMRALNRLRHCASPANKAW